MASNIGRASLSLTHLLVDEEKRLRSLQHLAPTKCNCGYLVRGTGILAIGLITIPVGIVETVLRIAIGIIGLIYLIIKGELVNYAKRTAKVLTAACCFAFDSDSKRSLPASPPSSLDTHPKPSPHTPPAVPAAPVPSEPSVQPVAAVELNPRTKHPEYYKAHSAYYLLLRDFLSKPRHKNDFTNIQTEEQWFEQLGELITLSPEEKEQVLATGSIAKRQISLHLDSTDWKNFTREKVYDLVAAFHLPVARLISQHIIDWVDQFNTIRVSYYKLLIEYNKLPVGHLLPKPIANLPLVKVMKELQLEYAERCREAYNLFYVLYSPIENLIGNATPDKAYFPKLVNAALPTLPGLNGIGRKNLYDTIHPGKTITKEEVNEEVLREIAFKIFDDILTRKCVDPYQLLSVGDQAENTKTLEFILYFCFPKEEGVNGSAPLSFCNEKNIEKINQFIESINKTCVNYCLTKNLYDKYMKDYPEQEPPFQWAEDIPR